MGGPLTLAVFDFDGTLFRSPDKPPWWPKMTYWITHPASLDVPCVPEKPGNTYWIGGTVADARKSIADKNVVTALITGRADNSFARYRVPELLKQQGLNFDSVHLSTSTDTASFKMTVIRGLMDRHSVDAVHIWEDHATNLGKFTKMIEGQGVTAVGHLIKQTRRPCMAPEFDTRVAHLTDRHTRQMVARQPTPESRAYQQDEKNRIKHVRGAQRAFRSLLAKLQPIADASLEMWSGKDKTSMQRRGREFSKRVKTVPAMMTFLNNWIGTEDQDPKAISWRSSVMYQARDVLLYGKTQKAALVAVGKQAFKGFEALTMAEAQAPYREVMPMALREYLPKNIVVDVDADGFIQKVTDRFENEHVTLGVKINKMRDLVRDYNKIAKKVKRDFKNRNEVIKMAAVITAIIMETGIRPGKAGNGKVVTTNGEGVFIETFGAISLGPAHVRFVRENFAELEFVGKMTSVNTASISDSAIINVLDIFVKKALKAGTKYVFITSKGVRFSYSDLQRYFRENFGDLTPSDFRKLKATETVMAALRDEQAALYDRIKGFANTAKGDLKERIVAAVVATIKAAIRKSQAALSHDNAATTVRSYINPEVILRFLSTGRVDENLEVAVLGGKSKLAFDPQIFLQAAMGRRASVTLRDRGHQASLALGDLLLEIRTDLDDAGVRKRAFTSVRLAERWVTAGVLQAPPALLSVISRWVQSTVAATELKGVLKGQKAFLGSLGPRKGSKLATRIQDVRAGLQEGLKVRALYTMVTKDLYPESFVASSVAIDAWGGVRKPGFKEFAAQYKAGNRWLTTVLDTLRLWVDGKDLGTKQDIRAHQERVETLRGYLVAGGKRPMTKGSATRDFPISKYMTGWRYEAVLTDPGKIARSRKIQAEKMLADFQRVLDKGSRQVDAPPPPAATVKMTKDILESLQGKIDEATVQSAGLAFHLVTVVVHTHTGARAKATWNPATKTITIYFPRSTSSWGMSGLISSVEHELQHMTQTLLQLTFHVDSAGLPESDALTPSYKQWMNQTKAWMAQHPYLRQRRDKAMQQLDSEGVVEQDLGNGLRYRTPAQKIDFHALDDIEFFTRLQDDIRIGKTLMSGLSGDVRDNAIDLYTYVTRIPRQGDKVNWYAAVQALGGYKPLKGVMHSPSAFFKALKGVPSARKKYTRAIREFRKELGYRGSNRAAAVAMLANRWVTAAGTATDIIRHFSVFVGAYSDLEKVIGDARGEGISGTGHWIRASANMPWVRIIDNGHKITDGLLSTRSIPRRQAKSFEMAYRLFNNSRRMPHDIYKWWAKNQKRLMFIIQAVQKWPEKVEGGEELFVLGSFRIHNTVGATGPELKSLKDTITKVERASKKNPVPGFARAVYGDIHVVNRITKAHHGAWYYPGDDSLYLRRGKKTGMDEVRVMIHELGHRWWAKWAPQAAKQAWLKHHVRVADQNLDSAQKVELPGIGDTIPVKVHGVKGDPIVTKMEGGLYYFQVPSGGEMYTLTVQISKIRGLYQEHERKKGQGFPTPYSQVNYEEHFCDALSLLALGKLPAKHAEPFKAIWSGKSHMAVRHIFGAPTIHLSPDWYDLPRGLDKIGLWVVEETLKLGGLRRVKVHSSGHADGAEPPEDMSESSIHKWDAAISPALNNAESFEKHKKNRDLNIRFRQDWARVTYEMDGRKLQKASSWHKRNWGALGPVERGYLVYWKMADMDGNPTQDAWVWGAHLKS